MQRSSDGDARTKKRSGQHRKQSADAKPRHHGTAEPPVDPSGEALRAHGEHQHTGANQYRAEEKHPRGIGRGVGSIEKREARADTDGSSARLKQGAIRPGHPSARTAWRDGQRQSEGDEEEPYEGDRKSCGHGKGLIRDGKAVQDPAEKREAPEHEAGNRDRVSEPSGG